MQVKCPNCGKQVTWGPDAPFRPFCSERCRLIDLGEWFDEEHKVAAEPSIEDLETLLPEELRRLFPDP